MSYFLKGIVHPKLTILSITNTNSLTLFSRLSFSQDVDGMDLEMLAPYISMDDDFQLTFLSGLPEETDTTLPSSSELPHVAPEVPVSRKRYGGPVLSLSLSVVFIFFKKHAHFSTQMSFQLRCILINI